MTDFSFEETIQISKEDWSEILASGSKPSKKYRKAIMLVAGVLFLFSPYTLVLGIILLSILFITVVLKSSIPFMSSYDYGSRKYYQHPIKYGVSQNQLWAESNGFTITSTWENIRVWSQTEKWLRLSPDGLLPIIFKIESLKEAGILETVLNKAEEFAVKYDSEEAKKAF